MFVCTQHSCISEVITVLRKSTVQSAARIANVSIRRNAQMFTGAHLHYFLLPCVWKTQTVGLHLWLLHSVCWHCPPRRLTCRTCRRCSLTSADTYFSERPDTSQRSARSKRSAVRYTCHWNLISGTWEESISLLQKTPPYREPAIVVACEMCLHCHYFLLYLHYTNTTFVSHIIIAIVIIIIIMLLLLLLFYCCLLSQPPLHDTALEPKLTPHRQTSNFRLHYFQYYVRCS